MDGALLITGANGRVGRLLAAACLRLGLPAILAHRCDDPLPFALPQIRWAPGMGALPLPGVAPVVMVALAGATPSTPGNLDQSAQLAMESVAAARAAGIGRVLVASSSAVYGVGRDAPWREDDTVTPTTPYGHAKRAAETALLGQNEVCALRIGNVAGADALLTNPARPLIIDRFADGTTPLRSYIGPLSMARALAALAQAPNLPPILNLATPAPVQMRDLAEAAGLPYVLRDAPPQAIARLTLDTHRLQSLAPLPQDSATPETLIAEWRACMESTA